jgi:hypothetical protein
MADFREERFLTGDSPLIPRASKMSTSTFSSEGTKMLFYVDESKNRRSEVDGRTRHDHESEI